MSTMTLNYPLFDGEKVIENASVTINDGIIASVKSAESTNSDCLLMPGLIDVHTHMTCLQQVKEMQKYGITATCDVSAPAALIEEAKPFTIVSSAGMTMGTLNGRSYVQSAIDDGAKYIKVLLFEPNLMPKAVLKSICEAAHEHALKVAVHATTVKAQKMAIDCGADILLHVPMKEELPQEVACEIAERGIAVAPTLVMMQAFADSARNGYKPSHYQNAEQAVRTLYECHATILAATDANIGNFAPAVQHGSSMLCELERLCFAGLTPLEALASATGKVADVFGNCELGYIKAGKKADLILIDGRPDKDIAAIKKIRQIIIGGEQIL